MTADHHGNSLNDLFVRANTALISNATFHTPRLLEGGKPAIIRCIANLVHQDEDLLSVSEFQTLLLARERLGTTGTNDGYAFPHAVVPGLAEGVRVDWVCFQTPIRFDDHNPPISLALVVLVADEQYLDIYGIALQLLMSNLVRTFLSKTMPRDNIYELSTEPILRSFLELVLDNFQRRSLLSNRNPDEFRSTVKVLNDYGIHARPSTKLAQLALEYQCEISIRVCSEDEYSDAKSVMDLMFLAAVRGTELELVGRGPRCVEAVLALCAMIRSGFVEDVPPVTEVRTYRRKKPKDP